MLAYKLVRKRKDGSLGSLFINRAACLPLQTWLVAEKHITPGYKPRFGWHCTIRPEAPHLSMKGRVWIRVEIQGVETFRRPENQGGTWLIAQRMKILEVLDERA